MGSVKDLEQRPALHKLRELAEDAKLCMFMTRLCGAPFNTRPMATQAIDDDGTMWFFSAADSTKNLDIARDNRVQLIYSDHSASEFLSVYGTAEIIIDKVKAKKLWNVFLTTWFPDGPEDENLTLLKVSPLDGYYWDTNHNRMIQCEKFESLTI
ncbi:MAG: pyridoxamine 5'-phosphate oxidase family protein [Chitinophagaceae bacterium]|nr:pyridoxamine 5'-phosphate oxidase family protein [Chitinophagaceae bacterium]